VGFGYTPPQSTPEHHYGASESEKNQLLMEGWESAPLNPSAPEMLQLYLDDNGELVPPTWHLIRNQGSGDFYTHDAKKFDSDSPQPILSDEDIRTLISNNESGPDITEHLQFQPPEPAKPGTGSGSPALEASRGSETIGESVFQKGSWKEFWLKASAQVPEAVSRTYLVRRSTGSGTPQITAVTLTIPKNGTHSTQGWTNGTIKLHPAEGESMSLLPVELILDSNNIAYKPDSEALGVSNYVTNNELPATSQFADTNPDPENFRLQARLPNSTTNSVQMKLEVKRDGAVVTTHNYTLDKKDGDFVRGQFLRLVTDTDDDAVSGDQTILVKLGDKIKVSYDIAAGSKVEQEIQVGRPSSEDNNEAGKPWKHDIRKLKLRLAVFTDANGTPCVTDAQITRDIDDANERLAQSGIVFQRSNGNAADRLAQPTSFSDGYSSSGGYVTIGTPDERAIAPLKDADANTIDVFYVHLLNTDGGRGASYPVVRNNSGDPKYNNMIIVNAGSAGGGDPMNLAHEIMHVLLNSAHRGDPNTAVFKGGTSLNKAVGGTKRIGPYPDATTSGVGQSDTTTIRQNAETLP